MEEERGTYFLTMEHVEGHGLDHLITAGGLPLSQVFDIGIALSDALAAAHEEEIAHRDMKPANVMGTVPYMAPEQVHGEATDGRPDLFALGVIFCELATGRRTR